jgi:hypothetical protein
MEDVCIVQPFAPNLFAQGDLPGPDTLLKFWRGEIKQDALKGAWSAKQPPKKSRKVGEEWPANMMLYCRGCSEKTGSDVLKMLKEFPDRGREHIWDRIIVRGMERMCTDCSSELKKTAGNMGKDGGLKGKEHGIKGKEHGTKGGASVRSLIFCAGCKTNLSAVAFDATVLAKLRKDRHQRRARCKDCCEKSAKADVVWCVSCEEWVLETKFDAEDLKRLRTIRKMTRATCLECVEDGTGRQRKVLRTWSRKTYTCTGCNEALPPSRFNAVKLRMWENENKLHLVECDSCDNTAISGPPVRCNLCQREKQRGEFAAVRRNSVFARWRCKECDFAPCDTCGKRPEKALHIAGRTTVKWTCQSCLYPPCKGCGSERPKKEHTKIHNMPEYYCRGCKKQKTQNDQDEA